MIDLLDLPAEIRVMIWSLLLPGDTTFVPTHCKQPRDLLGRPNTTVLESDKQKQSAMIPSYLLVLSPMTFEEVAHIFYGANTFCFDIRDIDVIERQTGSARSYINHIRLVDRLRYGLPTISIANLIGGFRSLETVSIPTYAEPFTVSSFDINLEHRAINLSIVRDLVEHLEEGHYKQLLLSYNQPYSPVGENLEHLLTLRLLRHLRSDQYYIGNKQTALWLEMFVAWIYSYPLKRSKLLNVLERMDPAYERNFLACLVEFGTQDRETKGFTIALSMPQNLPHGRHRAKWSCVGEVSHSHH